MLIIFAHPILQRTLTKSPTNSSVKTFKSGLDFAQLSPTIFLVLFIFHVANLILKQYYTRLSDFLLLPLGKEKEKWTSIDKDGLHRWVIRRQDINLTPSWWSNMHGGHNCNQWIKYLILTPWKMRQKWRMQQFCINKWVNFHKQSEGILLYSVKNLQQDLLIK